MVGMTANAEWITVVGYENSSSSPRPQAALSA
jgi:hypothetical protein